MMQSALITRMSHQQPPLLADDTNSSHSAASNSSTGEPLPPPPKKKRSLPGNPDPDAEVIALSPNSLLTTNRFICEICHKGFQRDQNLQLHRRGHNLPWKLKQRSKTEPVKKKVYVCPEKSCVHHDPSRALGDLTGIKKHFSRKHGEKKWKCNKCSRSYAVESDWKAHAKICGSKEYRCDCGAIFSRRDSFVTHKAFCNVLAEETARAITTNPLVPVTQQQAPAENLFNLQNPQLIEQENPQQTQTTAAQVFTGSSAFPSPTPPAQPPQPHLSATALLQMAAQMGAIISSKETSTTTGLFNGGSSFLRDLMMDSLPSFEGETLFGNGSLTRDFLGFSANATAASSSEGHNNNNN